MILVYAIQFSDGTHYIGSTVDFVQRIAAHLSGHDNSKPLRDAFRRNRHYTIYPVATVLSSDAQFKVEGAVLRSWGASLNMRSPEANMARPEREITVRGQVYTLAHAAAKFDVPINLLYQRLHRNWTPEQAVGVELRPGARLVEIRTRLRVKFEHDGVVDSVRGHCKRLGVPVERAYDRIRRGWSIEEALGKPARQRAN